MELEKLKTPTVNQNGYHKNSLTKERIGTLFIYPIDYTPDDYLSCDGYLLKINDYEDLHKLLGNKFNKSDDPTDSFRIPDYNVTGKFLQLGANVGNQVEAGLPNIVGEIGSLYFYNERVTNRYITGAFSQNSTWSTTRAIGNGGSDTQAFIGFNASRSNSIYGNNTTVQPPSQIVHICIKYK